MKTYQYKGEVRSAAGGRMLVPGEKCELPETDSHVQSLVAQGLLVEVPAIKQTNFKKDRNEQ